MNALGPGTRVVYDFGLRVGPAHRPIEGYLDDTVACTAILLAAGVLRHYPVEVLIGLTDEEEGPPGDANQSFGRGGRRLVRLFEPPELAIVSDVHESEAMVRGPGPRDIRPGDGAVFAERSSSGRGTATPPHLYALEQHLAVALSERGISLPRELGRLRVAQRRHQRDGRHSEHRPDRCPLQQPALRPGPTDREPRRRP